ncbi:MAG: DUF507 family protein [Nitrospirae bacterium]|uniref:DUF507 family protein n=1 Tax=Candidatus Magnetobacterium casense TaxID=1455061 RepID=UPI00058CF122|nr:DUF507 family protein [Candidatus Magnetobacterium casensis]MBF0336411.1 DUF507 family protein [Nitrospirota bacterium]
MRIPKSWLPIIAGRIVNSLVRGGFVEPKVAINELCRQTEALLYEELTVEDRLADEVRQILRSFEGEIERKHLDYKALFDMTKQRLIKERNIVI